MKLKLPEGAFRAYLFDCDGTIADSMPLHYIAWKRRWGMGLRFDEELFYAWGGKPTRRDHRTLNEMNGLKMPVEAVAQHKEELYFDLLPRLKAIPEVVEHIEARARPASLRRGLGRQAQFGCPFAHRAASAG
jgi:beta-phosphoglucomutase-like phosphatase (HAD superfamily)